MADREKVGFIANLLGLPAAYFDLAGSHPIEKAVNSI